MSPVHPYIKILIVLFLFSGIPDQLVSQRNVQSFRGARSLSMGDIKAGLDGSDAIIHNFSNICNTDGHSAIIGSEQRFGLSELTAYFAGVHFNAGDSGHFGFSLASFGFTEYRESKIALAYARKLGKELAISIQFDYNQIRIDEFGSSGSFGFALGMNGTLPGQLQYAFVVANPEKIELAENTEARSFLQFGLMRKLNAQVRLFTELEKNIDEDLSIKLGAEYQISERLRLNFGFNTHPGSTAFGFAYSPDARILIEMAASYNNLLGLSPGISIKFR